MFEANHQCVANVRIFETGETVASTTSNTLSCSSFYCQVETRTYMAGREVVEDTKYESAGAWSRCDVYSWWANLTEKCRERPQINRIAFTFDHSINGGPFYRIVDTVDICTLTYLPFVHNSWIHTSKDAPVIGFPVQNYL